ncbi:MULTISPECIES: carbohydrate kinase family protein [unclassified Mycobacterium]|uniref:carbohydrate kinase family protein n=1 Tax=Mycobacterium sp. DL99 TaxID=2528957 RepID=UPI0010810979|nr:carbohydrate kinase family protein [Mycobacterium sp. DL99]
MSAPVPAAGRTAVFIGDVALDEYYRMEKWPTPPDKAMVQMLPPVTGGMIANAACRYAGYSGSCELVTALNGGAVAEQLLHRLGDNGVGVSHVLTDPALNDSRTMIYLVGDEHVVFIPEVGEYQVPVTPELGRDLATAPFIYSTPMELHRLRPPGDVSGRELLQDVRAAGVTVAVDLDVCAEGEEHDDLLSAVDIVLVNEVGMARLDARSPGGSGVEALLAKGIRTVVVTLGAGGATAHTDDGTRIAIAGIPVSAVDVTGAGDAFGSSLMYGLTAGWDLQAALVFANAAAARTVTEFGPQAGIGPVGDVVQFLDNHDPAGAAVVRRYLTEA